MTRCKCEKLIVINDDVEDYRDNHLVHLRIDLSTWESLYKCPDLNIYWKEYFTGSDHPAFGIWHLIQITEEEARNRFGYDHLEEERKKKEMKHCQCEKLTEIHDYVEIYRDHHLVYLKRDELTWETLYKCPDHNIYWKEYSINPEYHGGGIPHLIQISEKEAKDQFGYDHERDWEKYDMKYCQCERLVVIIRGAEDYRNDHLVRIKADLSSGEGLYKCPDHNIYWLEYYKDTEEQGSDILYLVKITEQEAGDRFGI